MPGPPAPGFCLCHLLSSADFLLSPLPPVAPAVRTLGSRATRFIVAHTSIREQRKQAAPGAACWKKKTGDQSEPWPPPACCAAAIPEPGSADAALEPLLDPPPTQGCANGITQSPGGCPAGKAVWTRLIITPGKLRAAL